MNNKAADLSHRVSGFGVLLTIVEITIHVASSIAYPNSGNHVNKLAFVFSLFGAIFVSPLTPLKSLKPSFHFSSV